MTLHLQLIRMLRTIAMVLASLFFTVNFCSATTAAASITPEHPAEISDQHIKQQAKQQENLYRQTLTAIRKGHKSNSKYGLQTLQDYPLYPYLAKAELSKRLKRLPYQDVDQFLQTYQGTITSKQLRKQWLKVLAGKQRWPEFIQYYEKEVANSELQCRFLEALHQSNYRDLALSQTTAVWLTAKSMPDACNPAFKRWQQAGLQTDTLVWQRTVLALSNNNRVLARYLSNHASAELKPFTRRLISVHRRPQRLAQQQDFSDNSRYTADIVSHGLIRLARKDSLLATRLWVDYRGPMSFSAEQHRNIRNKIAREIIASDDGHALDWLIIHDPNADDSYLLEWRIRLALKKQHWTQAQQWISILPTELQQQPRWQYWLARAQHSNHNPEALARLKKLATERHYYGFLAADILKLNYGFNHQDLPSVQLEQHVETSPSIQRAHTFFQLGELTAARREWFSAIQGFDQQQLIAATNLAHHWGWHQQAIHTTIKAKQWNDLSIRFPLAHQRNMTHSAKSAAINLEWLYAVARQESAFAQDAQSSVGARGLLQLRPRTAKEVANNIGIKFRTQDLFKAEKNIKLGSNYLKQLLEDFEGNRILATAAYNAGPYRVKKWLKRQQTALPYDIWIETLPYQETRNYVQNVLAFSVIYGHRLGVDSPLIEEKELVIGNHL